jgi:hypothetical protein
MLAKVILGENVAPDLQFDWSLVPDHILFKKVALHANEMSGLDNVDERSATSDDPQNVV